MLGQRFDFTLRGGVGFGLGGLGVLLCNQWVLGPRGYVPLFSSAALLAGLFACGALAGTILTIGRLPAVRAAIGFGLAFLVVWFGDLFTLMGLQSTSSTPYVQLAVEHAVYYGLAGAIGGVFLWPRLALYAAAEFAAAGAISVPLAYGILGKKWEPVIAFAIAGLLFGIVLDRRAARNRDQTARSRRIARAAR